MNEQVAHSNILKTFLDSDRDDDRTNIDICHSDGRINNNASFDYNEDEEAIIERTKLAPKVKNQINSKRQFEVTASFVWNARARYDDAAWEETHKQLVACKKECIDTKVPYSYKDSPHLGSVG